MGNQDTELIGFRLDRGVLELVDRDAERTERTRSGMLRHIINDWFMDRAAAKLVDSGVEYRTEEAGDDHVPH